MHTGPRGGSTIPMVIILRVQEVEGASPRVNRMISQALIGGQVKNYGDTKK